MEVGKMDIYVKIDSEKVIRDCITYEHEGFVKVEVEEIPYGILGGWFKLENGKIVEYPELKPLSQEVELQKIKEKLQTATEYYNELDVEQASLEEMKVARNGKLKEECNAAINAGFVSGENEFSFDEKDQSNFTQRLITIALGAEGPFKWKTKNNGVVEFTKEEFLAVVGNAEAHKIEQQEKFWVKEAAVLSAESKEELLSITW